MRLPSISEAGFNVSRTFLKRHIWAFGCVLFEMLAGRVAFREEDVSEILASVIKGDLQLDLLPEDLHPRVREAITRCLQKDVRRRYSSITEARYEIEQALADPGGVFAAPAAALENRSPMRSALNWFEELKQRVPVK